ncbi:hypothetical protein ATCVGM07011_290R [Acanthocystis turfacea Chlorella virus GM0701.1]|nr:hypothetical protein ATCVGM07011_290R [Acanthocystis turfacea Chlorella virus GM0701.1]
MSRWAIITVSGIVIASAMVIAVLFYLIQHNDKAEKEADALYLQQKADLLKTAVESGIGSSASTAASSALVGTVKSSSDKVNGSTSALAGVISRQKALLKTVRDKYSTEKARILS